LKEQLPGAKGNEDQEANKYGGILNSEEVRSSLSLGGCKFNGQADYLYGFRMERKLVRSLMGERMGRADG
jgi:hypothetical protein